MAAPAADGAAAVKANPAVDMAVAVPARTYGRGYGQDFGRDYRGGGSQGGFGGNDYSRGNYGADQGYRQDYSGRSRDYGQQGRGERGLWDRASDEVSSWFGDDDAERRRRMDEQRGGQHRGRGPKGYTRSDDRIREDVNDRLSDDPFVDASEIEVTRVVLRSDAHRHGRQP